MNLSQVRPTVGAVRRRKRVGRGNASGHGTYSTRGGKGQTARSGYRIVPGFEGGQTPVWKKIPKRGFTNVLRREYAVVNVGTLNERFESGARITPKVLRAAGLVDKLLDGIKILGDGELTKKLTIKAHKFSESALKKIQAAGGEALSLLPKIEKKPGKKQLRREAEAKAVAEAAAKAAAKAEAEAKAKPEEKADKAKAEKAKPKTETKVKDKPAAAEKKAAGAAKKKPDSGK
ncbi:50S ribosomal protein L15 [Candidatus Acetothermia bacterium]|nr:50S ribosomal protein L15 [Candidatus Acetothermia bacterium]MBI3460992.1 50S ribosomal protein L15 [Candidatus Acetothermia bacterium]MBI3659198.1 50S ribosomal protein L15 [Candidatus Acetothermia bacterium]